jgi:methyltransferase (TIGR00027 family)
MSSQPKPDFTAWFVMQGTIATMCHPAFREVADETMLALYQPLSNAASKTRLISRIIYSLPYAWQYKIGELVTDTGRLSHFCFRKKEIEKQARKLIEGENAKQVIILGAGLDVLSLRLAHEYPAVKFIEIDTKESQDFKIASFTAHSVPLPENVEFIMGDLRNPLFGILAGSKFHDAAANTLWIAEGFFMFIPEESVVKILKEIRQLSAAGSHVIFTSLPSYKPASPLRHMLQAFYLHKENSPYRWVVAFNDVPSFMTNLGYQGVSQMDYETLQKSYMPQKCNVNHDIIENIHIAKT